MDSQTVPTLKALDFGSRVAEEETSLESYFVETTQWSEVYSGSVDVIYGPKGSGKSAIHSLLLKRQTELGERGILLINAENPQGSPAFSDLVGDPPSTEREFEAMWNLYFLILICDALENSRVENQHSRRLRESLEGAGLMRGGRSLKGLLRVVRAYIRSRFKVESIEGGADLQPSGMPGVHFKINFDGSNLAAMGEPSTSIEDLYDLAKKALSENQSLSWILLDRLDVAFAESPALERNALRSLFRVYRDLSGIAQIRLKIFLRSDIWSRVADAGFREASHITKTTEINWSRPSLLNLVVRRLIQNPQVRERYEVDGGDVLRDLGTQEGLFSRIFPEKVDPGKKRPSTFDWILSRTKDGTQGNAPRELIHLLTSSRQEQLRQIETGESQPDGERLFTGNAIKNALPAVSKVRLEQTLYAEYPDIIDCVEKLRGARTNQTIATLSEIWGLEDDKTLGIAENLVRIGFFEARGVPRTPEYWIPFLYRDSLELVQGTEE